MVISNVASLTWYSYPLLYKEIRGISYDENQMLSDFSALQVFPSVSMIKSAENSDKFFEKYGVGNELSKIDKPFERFHAYELLLATLAEIDPQKYKIMHKGTPFYFLGWTAFQTENYEKGIYYLDQSVSEDIRKSESTDINILKPNPGVSSFLLNPNSQAGAIMALELRTEMDSRFSQFRDQTGLYIDAQTFVENFVIKSGRFYQNSFRTIITSIYSFALEYRTLVTALNLRSSGGGSMEPFYLHLFKGGLILESLLKLNCPPKIKTLNPAIQSLNSKLNINLDVLKSGTLEETIEHISNLTTSKESFENLAFATAYGIRNTTGHNLTWSDIFNNNNNYQKLFLFTFGAILWTIHKLWLEENPEDEIT